MDLGSGFRAACCIEILENQRLSELEKEMETVRVQPPTPFRSKGRSLDSSEYHSLTILTSLCCRCPKP